MKAHYRGCRYFVVVVCMLQGAVVFSNEPQAGEMIASNVQRNLALRFELSIEPARVRVGDSFEFQYRLVNDGDTQITVISYLIHGIENNGITLIGPETE